jgi:hypothetical protein|tara:strand:+ start:3766 stop:4146 length:381 start_codon:yes stop_codon:yes gene_type:complete
MINSVTLPLLFIVLSLGQTKTTDVLYKENNRLERSETEIVVDNEGINNSKLYEDPVNIYSIGHIIFWYGMSQFSEIETQHMLAISLGWELLELYLPYEFAKESYFNKVCDIFFNCLGFFIGKQQLK